MITKLSKLPKFTSPLTHRLVHRVTSLTDQLTFTPNFHKALQQKLEQKSKDSFLRLEISAGEGCEGFTYKFKFDDVLNREQDLIKMQVTDGAAGLQNRVIFAVDKQEVRLLKGATLDYAEEMMRQIFYVKENPNAQLQCSCKVSFSPKPGLL